MIGTLNEIDKGFEGIMDQENFGNARNFNIIDVKEMGEFIFLQMEQSFQFRIIRELTSLGFEDVTNGFNENHKFFCSNLYIIHINY